MVTRCSINYLELLPKELGYVVRSWLPDKSLGRIASTSRKQRDHQGNEYEWRRRLKAYTDVSKTTAKGVMRKHRTLASTRRRIREGRHSAPAWLKRSRKFVEEILQISPNILRYKGWDQWTNDRQMVLLSVRHGALSPYAFCDDKEVMRALIDHDLHGHVLSIMSPSLRTTNRALVIHALEHGSYIRSLSPEQRDDKELAMIAVTHRTYNYRDLSDRLKGDKDVLRIVLPHVTLAQALSHGAPDAVLKSMMVF